MHHYYMSIDAMHRLLLNGRAREKEKERGKMKRISRGVSSKKILNIKRGEKKKMKDEDNPHLFSFGSYMVLYVFSACRHELQLLVVRHLMDEINLWR